jgi:signal transduction histidine kinase
VASLAGSLELVQTQVDRGEVPASEDIGLIRLVKNRLQEHTRALKDLSRPRDRSVEGLDVGSLVCAAVDMLKKAGVLKVARTQIDRPHSALHVDADRALMEGALINLIKNAAEALAEKAEASSRAARDDDEIPLITISVEPRGEEGVAIVVEDNGPGVAQENIERVFKTYFTTKTGSGGTGLGLAIVRETIQQHGGRIDVLSALGEGTRFTIVLPLSGCSLEDARGPRGGERGNSGLRLASRSSF